MIINTNSRKKNKGFTLVELIVVIVIILVLAAVLVPSVLRYVAKAQEAKCKSGRDTLATEYSLAIADEKIPWDENTPNIADLQSKGILPKFSCPYGGEIYARKNTDGTISIRCKYHDDGVTGGSGTGGHNFPGQSLMEQLSKFMEDNSLVGKDNKYILDKFYGDKKPGDLATEEKVSDVLTDEKIDDLIPKIAKAGNISEDTAKKALEKYKTGKYTVAPFVCSDGKIIMYYAQDEKWESSQKHSSTNLLYYEGSWYFVPNMNGLKDSFTGSFVLPQLRQEKDLENKLNTDYIKIS